MIIGMILLGTVSCQKEEIQDNLNTEEKEELVDFRTSLLQLVYEIPADQLDDPATEALYQSLMENMTDHQLAELKEILATYAQTSAGDRPVDWRSDQTETVLSAGIEEDYFGQSIARNENTLFVGASGHVYVYQNETLAQTLTASNGAPNFGSLVVSYGNWLAVGAGSGCDSDGQVILFQKQGNSWVEQDIIDVGFQCFVGATGGGMAMHGNTLAVMGRDLGICNISVYNLTDNNWTLDAVLEDGDTFWWDLAILNSTIVANGGSNVGSGIVFSPKIYVFEKQRRGNAWQLETIPFPPGNLLSRNVAIRSGLIVGNTAFGPNNSYVFTPAGGSWAVTGSVSARGILAVGASKIVVGAPTQSSVGNPNDAVYVFQESGGTWNLTETLTPSTGGLDYVYGSSLAVQGSEVTVGAPGNFFFTSSCCPFQLTPLGTPPGAVFIYN